MRRLCAMLVFFVCFLLLCDVPCCLSLFIVRCLLSVVCRLPFVVWCSLLLVRCLLLVVCSLLLVTTLRYVVVR